MRAARPSPRTKKSKAQHTKREGSPKEVTDGGEARLLQGSKGPPHADD